MADPPRMIANKEEIMILFLSRGYLSVKNIHGKSTDVVSDNLMLHFVRLSYRNEKMKKKEKEKGKNRKDRILLVTCHSKMCVSEEYKRFFFKCSNLNYTIHIGSLRLRFFSVHRS